MGKAAAPSQPAETSLATGCVFAGRYEINSLLGEGDRKRTYRAEDILLGRVVALSVVKPAAAEADPQGTWREVQALVQTGNHDNIVTLYDRGSAEGTEYLVFEYLPSGTLREHLARCAESGNRMTVDEVMQLGRQLARALAHIHGRRLIHRDISPANVWLDQRRVAHLGDFDSVISLDSPQDPGGLPLTTKGYAAPEELAGQHIDERSDLYSLGAILYEALAGERPARDPRDGAARRLADLRPDIPHKLRALIGRLLAESPDQRPPRADDVLQALTQTHGSATADLQTWAETLPFPLASILWHYDCDPEAAAKVEYLLKFFEALAEFAATIQLSAYLSDRTFFDTRKAEWFGNGAAGISRLDLRRATFGSWVELASRLAGTGRDLLDNDPADYRRLFSASDPALPEVLASPGLDQILVQARNCRNNWSGHGGIAGPQVHDERLSELRQLLTATERLIGWSFETWTLLKPGRMTYSDGVFDLTAAVLSGANSAFRKDQFQLTEPLSAKDLYLLNDGSTHALSLAPLVRFIDGSKIGEEACYFYNRLEADKVRWVSYHFQADPELTLPDNDVTEFLASLRSPR